MSHPPLPRVLPVLQPVAEASELHPRLRSCLERSRRRPGADLDWSELLRRVSEDYEAMDAERRGIVRSMQMIAEETSRQGSGSPEAAHLQAILDHINDVVITVAANGSIQVFNPTGERVFGYAESELIGQPISRLLPDLPLHGSLQQGLQALTASAHNSRGDPRPKSMQARRKDLREFPAELVANRVALQGRDAYVICLRDSSERLQAEQALRDSEARYRTLVESAPEVILLIDSRSGRFVDFNENALRFFRRTRTELPECGMLEVSATEQNGKGAAAAAWQRIAADALAGEAQSFEWLFHDRDGRETPADVRLMTLPGTTPLLRVSITDISARKRAERIASGERHFFELVAANAALSQVLEAIVAMVESPHSDVIAAISLLDDDARCLAEVIGPRLPEGLRAAETRTMVDIRNGSSAAAVYLGRQVLVANTGKDAIWQRRRELAAQHQLGSAWAMPIKNANGRVHGALCLYRRLPGLPAPGDLELMTHAARLAGIAIERRRSETALRDSESKYRGLYESMLEGVYQCAPDGRVKSVNPAFVRLLGYDSAEQVLALPNLGVLYWDPKERAAFEARLSEDGAIHNAEHRLRRRDGMQLVVLESARVLRNADQSVSAYEGTLADITERKRNEEGIFAEKERLQVTLQSIGDAVITSDASGRIDYLNPIAEQLLGWTAQQAQGRAITEVLRLHDENSQRELENPLLRCLRDGRVANFGEHSVLVNRNGEQIAIQDSAAPIRDSEGKTIGAVIVFRDVTKERRLKRALSYQASHDALTGLINRREFDYRLERAVDEARENRLTHALLYVDLDQFKLVNDTCGHSAGDRLLRDITGVLQQHVRSSDIIARLGGDEFGVLMPICTNDQASRVAENIRRAIREFRFVWNEVSTHIGASIGMVEINADTESVASIMSAADIACYAAKEAGRNRVHAYDASEASGRHREMYWVGRVTRAVDENRLELHHQPIVPVGGGGAPPVFHELLVRLYGEDGELVPPGEFIPAAERYNVISAIDRWVVGRAAAEVRRLAGEGGEPRLFSVNISGTSLSDRSFLDFLLKVVEDPLVARGLCFEITETAVITNLSQTVHFMRELKMRGCRFALDDFGSGLSSFHYLKHLPVDFLKIDGQFVANAPHDPVDRSMVEAICQVGRALGIATVAEKVESAEVFALLGQMGVDYAQGYHIARPAPLQTLVTPA